MKKMKFSTQDVMEMTEKNGCDRTKSEHKTKSTSIFCVLTSFDKYLSFKTAFICVTQSYRITRNNLLHITYNCIDIEENEENTQ
jgi:hypothetical protein